MVSLIAQIIGLIALMIGIFLGESLVLKVFGKIKSKFLLIDIIVFVILISIIYSFFSFTELGLMFYIINFGIGLLTVIILRAFEAAVGFTESTAIHEKISVNIIRALARYGLSEDEIKGVLKRSGISPKTVERLSGIIDESVPVYAPKILKMTSDIEEIKKDLSIIKKEIIQLKFKKRSK